MNDIYKSVCVYGILLICLLSYYVLGVLFLVEDYSGCNNSNLWEYVLISLVLLLLPKILIVKNVNNYKCFGKCCCIGLDLSLIVWGFYELYGNNLCEELERLWNFGLTTLLANILWVIIILLLQCLYCIDSGDLIEKNNKINIDNVRMVTNV